MGTIFSFFQSAGRTPCEYDSWNIRASGSAIDDFCRILQNHGVEFHLVLVIYQVSVSGHIVLDGDAAHSPQRDETPIFQPISVVAK